jgi:nitrogen fixation protein FixH
MKLHWGTGLAVVFVIFAIGILIMVRTAMNRDVELVSDDYYQQELRHEDQIQSQKRSNDLSDQPIIGVSRTWVAVRLPTIFSDDSTSGTLTFYRPADRHKDFIVALKLDSTNTQFVPTTFLKKGLWRLKVRWAHHLRDYYHEEAIVIQ